MGAPFSPDSRRQLLFGTVAELAVEPAVLSAQASVLDAARLMATRRTGYMVVVDDARRPLGVVTETALLAAAQQRQDQDARVTGLMQPVQLTEAEADAALACRRCLDGGGVPLLLVDAQGGLAGAVGEGEFRSHLQLAALAGRHQVSAVMTRVLRPLAPQDTVAQAIAHMRVHQESAVVVLEGEQAVGVLTTRDVARLMAEPIDANALPLASVMSRPVLTLPPHATVNEAAARMLQSRTRHLVVVDESGRVAGVLDEHELTRALALELMDAGIEQERARQRAVLQHIPDLIWLKDPDGVYLTCNPRFERLYGATEAQIRGRTDFDFVPRETAEFFRAMDQRAIEQGGPSLNEEELTYADGHRELVQTIKTPVRDAQGRLLGVLGIGRDITGLRRAEGEYRWLFERNPAPMLVYDRQTLALLRANEAFCTLYGWTDAELRALKLTDLYLPEDQDAVAQRVPTLQGLVHVGEWRHRRRDGSLIHVVAQSHDTLHEGREARVVAITDVSSLQRSRQRDRQRLAVMELLARGERVQTVLEQLARDHETLFPGSLCSVLLVDGDQLRHAAAPSLPEFYNQAIDGVLVGPDVGSCGAAAHWRERVIVSDIDTHPNWVPFRDLARRAGLRACWSEPVLGPQGRALGTFAVYRREPLLPAPEELEQMQFAVQLAATVIGHAGTARALRESETRLNTILQALPDMVWLKDTDGVYRMCNASFARMAGRAVDEIVGRTDFDITSAERAALWSAQDREVLSGGKAMSEERWLTVRDSGERVLVEIIKSPMHDEAGRRTGVLGVARDITLIKQGASAIAEQDRLIDALFGQTTDSIAVVDPDTRRFVSFNDAACQGLGYTRQEFADLGPADLREDGADHQVKELHERTLAGESVRFEIRHRRRDGSLQDALVTLRTVGYRGRQLLSAVWRDVTEERRLQRRAERLRRAYALLGGVNEAVVQLRDDKALFAEVCRTAVEAGGFCLAWVGTQDARGALVEPVAWYGQGGEFLGQLRVPLRESGGTPTARAYRRRQPEVVPDIAADISLAHRSGELQALGHRSMSVFPIGVSRSRWHCLVLYSDTADHFDDEQITVLSRLARDIEHALHFIEAEQAQEEAQRFREQIIESVAGLFFAVDTQGRLALWNRRLQELSGRAAPELEGLPFQALFGADEVTLAAEQVRLGVDAGEMRMEASLQARDGTRVPHLFVGRRVDTTGGALLVGTGVDISDRVRSERELANYRDQLEHLVQQRTAELEAVNARLHREDRRLRAMLRLSQRASVLSEDEILRDGLAEIIALTRSQAGCVRSVGTDGHTLELRAWSGTPEAPPDRLAQMVVDQGQVCVADEALLRSVGGDRLGMTQALGTPVIEGGRAVMVVCATNKPEPYDEVDRRELQLLAGDLWQIVQRRRIEIALGQAKVAADAASQAKSAFLANMSHEIRTPMNAIIGFAHLLTRDPLTPRQRDHLGKITDASQHLLQVINDILDFSKIEAHKITLEETDFVLRDSLARVLTMQSDAARAKRLPIELAVHPRVPAVLRGDRLRLEQILLNLLSNAVKFTPAGRIDVRVDTLVATVADAPPTLRLEVGDTGIGMTDEQLQHVFEAFAQADASTTRRFGGTGLGLAISKRLVHLMGGRIGARSQPGRGSTFWVELPLHAGNHDAATRHLAQPDTPRSPSRLRDARILVVEDNPINQEVTSTLLGALGARVQIAASGEDALRVFDPAAHDLILMDVQMPGMDGLRATAAIRARAGGQAVPIVAMTANAFAEDRAQCLAAGMNDYLAKPVEPQALEHCLLRWLPESPPAAPAPAVAAGADGEARLRERLQAIAGLDIAGPLARMRGAFGLYVRMLRMFATHHGADADRLLALPAADVASMRALAHSISGAAATVGAVDVVQAAQALQAAVTAAGGGEIELALRRPLADALRLCLLQVQAALSAPASAPATADPAAARTVLRELAPLLAAHDTSALVLYEHSRAVIEAAFGDPARELGRQLQQFDFGAAQLTLAALVAPAQSEPA
ncbi:MAG: PAS domain S-box protein [Rubrivivax sp.]